MENEIEVKYCRREVSVMNPDNTWTPKPCGDRISKKNALNWCDGCRARLPLWPADSAPIAQEAATHGL